MKTPPRKIAPLSVWIVGHPQNPLIHDGPTTNNQLAVFYKRKDAQAFKKAHEGTFYRVYKATVIRDGQGPDYRAQRDHAEAELAECIGKLNAATSRIEATETELNNLRKQINDGKIWNTENPRWTPRTQSALGLAAKEAIAQGATYVGTEHVLLGLLKQGEGIAHRHFLACGMTYEKAEYAMRVSRHS